MGLKSDSLTILVLIGTLRVKSEIYIKMMEQLVQVLVLIAWEMSKD